MNTGTVNGGQGASNLNMVIDSDLDVNKVENGSGMSRRTTPIVTGSGKSIADRSVEDVLKRRALIRGITIECEDVDYEFSEEAELFLKKVHDFVDCEYTNNKNGVVAQGARDYFENSYGYGLMNAGVYANRSNIDLEMSEEQEAVLKAIFDIDFKDERIRKEVVEPIADIISDIIAGYMKMAKPYGSVRIDLITRFLFQEAYNLIDDISKKERYLVCTAQSPQEAYDYACALVERKNTEVQGS